MAKATYGSEKITPSGRVQFSSLVEKGNHEGKDTGYAVTLIFDGDTDLSDLENEVVSVAKKEFGDDVNLNSINLPFRLNLDANEKGWEGFSTDGYFIKANTFDRVACVDTKRKPLDPSEVYDGSWARIKVTPASYNVSGNKGVKLWLNGVQFVKNDDAFKGSSETQFDEIEGESPAPQF